MTPREEVERWYMSNATPETMRRKAEDLVRAFSPLPPPPSERTEEPPSIASLPQPGAPNYSGLLARYVQGQGDAAASMRQGLNAEMSVPANDDISSGYARSAGTGDPLPLPPMYERADVAGYDSEPPEQPASRVERNPFADMYIPWHVLDAKSQQAVMQQLIKNTMAWRLKRTLQEEAQRAKKEQEANKSVAAGPLIKSFDKAGTKFNRVTKNLQDYATKTKQRWDRQAQAAREKRAKEEARSIEAQARANDQAIRRQLREQEKAERERQKAEQRQIREANKALTRGSPSNLSWGLKVQRLTRDPERQMRFARKFVELANTKGLPYAQRMLDEAIAKTRR